MTTRHAPSVPHKRKVLVGVALSELNQKPTTFNNHNRLDDDLSSTTSGAGGGLSAARQISHNGLFSSISDTNLQGMSKRSTSKDKDSEKDKRAESEKEVRREKDLIPDSIIGAGVDIKGTMAFKSLLRVDGRFEGELVSKGNITVSSTGLIVGNIANINCLTINGGGKVFGNISAEKVIILDNGCIEGDLSCKMLQMGFSGSIIGRMYVHPLGGGKYESPETTLRKNMSKGGAKKRRNSVVNTIIVLNDGSTGERMNIEANTPRDWDDMAYDADDYETDQSMIESDTTQRLSDDNKVEKRDYNIPVLVPHYIPGGGGSLSERTGIRTTIAHPLANHHIDDINRNGSRMKKDGIASSSSPTKKKINKDNNEIKDHMKRRDSNGNSVVSQQKSKDTVPRRRLSLSEKKAEKAELKAEKAELKELKKEEKRLEEMKVQELARMKFEEEAEAGRQSARIRVAEKIAAEEREWIEKEEKKIRDEVERDLLEKARIEEENKNLIEAKRQIEEEEFLLIEKQRREEDEKKRDEKEKEKIRIENEWKEGEDKKKKEKEEKKFLEDEARRKEIEMIERIERQRNETNMKNKDDKEKKKREDEKLRKNQNQNQNQNQNESKSQSQSQVVPGMKSTKIVSDEDGDGDGGDYDDDHWDENSEKRR